MSVYIRYFGYFVYLLVLWDFSRRNRDLVTKKEIVCGKTVTRYNWIFALIAVIPLVFFAGTRSKTIGDTGSYMSVFDNAPASISEIPDYIGNMNKDQMFYAMTVAIKHFFGNSYKVYFTLIALFQAVVLASVLRIYSENYLISLFIFFASADYMSFMNNGIRQFIAVCIIFGASQYIFERKYIHAFISVIIAAQFHQSALIMLPIILIVQGKPWNKSTTIILLFALLSMAFVGNFTNILESMLSETNYSNIVTSWKEWGDDGTNPLRVAVYCVPSLLSILGLRYIREDNNPVINVCTNMSIVTVGLYVISMVTSGVYIGRLPIYVSLFSNCILLPWEIRNIFNRETSVFINNSMIICYILFYYYQIHFIWSAV